MPTFKEGAQVRLECRSSGGKPAPRIEWLNLTSGGAPKSLSNEHQHQQQLANERLNDNDQSMMMMMMTTMAGANNNNKPESEPEPEPEPELQLMRSFWPIKRATYFTSSFWPNGAALDTQAAGPAGSQNFSQHQRQQQQQLASAHSSNQVPVTSSSITITVSRYDLRSRFICLVLPQQQTIMNSPQPQQQQPTTTLGGLELPLHIRRPSQLAALLDNTPMLTTTSLAAGPMLKWVKLNVLGEFNSKLRAPSGLQLSH